MIYTGGVIKDINRKETLEELQDNKMALVCHKLELQPTDTLLDIGCGWGTLCAYAGKNFGCDVTGVTLGKNQTKFGNDRLQKNGVEPAKGRILCTDFRDLDANKVYSKIVSLEMAEVSFDSDSLSFQGADTDATRLSTLASVDTTPSSAKSTTTSTTTASSSCKCPASGQLGNTRTSSGESWQRHPPHSR